MIRPKQWLLALGLMMAVPAAKAQLTYYDAADFPLLGKAAERTETRYERLPAEYKQISRGPVWELGKCSAGLAVRFRSNSTTIAARWTALFDRTMNHQTQTGTRGLDLYCLQEDPAYRMQCTTKGYYQSPNPGFYLGFDMPRPPLPPVMATDLVWQSTDTFTSYDRSATAGYADGKSVLIDLNTATQIDVSRKMSPSVLYAMPVKGQTVTLDGNGSLAGDMELWKSQAGTLVADIPLRHSGTTHISEGTLAVTSEVSGKIDLRARGTLAGHGAVNDICFEGALNHEGGRIAPDGTLTFKKGLHMDRKVYVEMDLADGKTQADLLRVEGDLAVSAPVVFTIVNNGTKPQPGRYKLIEYSGAFSGSADSLSISGLDGLAREIAVEDGSVCLIVHEQRQPADGVDWTGAESGTWDYSALNFQLKDGTATAFVALDTLTFGDKAEHTVISVDETMPAGGITVANSQTEYTFRGEGRIGGEGALTKDGEGTLNLDLTQNDYTGATILRGGTLRVKALADGGRPSSIGAATADAGNLQIGRATLDIDNANTATNRGITLTDTATLKSLSDQNYTVLRDYGDAFWCVRMAINDATNAFADVFTLPEAPRYGVGRGDVTG